MADCSPNFDPFTVNSYVFFFEMHDGVSIPRFNDDPKLILSSED